MSNLDNKQAQEKTGWERNNRTHLLPADLAALLKGYSCSETRAGCSTAGVYRYHNTNDALYLKVSHADFEILREHELLLWLNGKLPVPAVRYWCEHDGLAYLLTKEVPGYMTCDSPEDKVTEPVENTIRLLAEGLLMLQRVDISSCPFSNTLDKKLDRALSNIRNDLVDMEDWEESNEFDSPMELFHWLTENRLPEDVCFTHGDFCLPNVFIDGTSVTGFIDIGRGGIADMWQDIALCVRSLGYNLGNIGKTEKDRYINMLFSHLGIEPDWEKIKYYILLDELF